MTVSRFGQRIASTRRRRSSSASCGTSTPKSRIGSWTTVTLSCVLVSDTCALLPEGRALPPPPFKQSACPWRGALASAGGQSNRPVSERNGRTRLGGPGGGLGGVGSVAPPPRGGAGVPVDLSPVVLH